MPELGGTVGALVFLAGSLAITCFVLAAAAYFGDRRASRFDPQGRKRIGIGDGS